jgi:AcrR family transcriptional regulator
MTVPTTEPTPNDRRSYHHGELAAALKHAVLDLVAEGGLESVTMSGAARRAGVSSGAPYHHYGSLEALISATALDAYHHLRRRQERILDDLTNPGEQLLARIDDYFAFAIDEPARFALIFEARTPRPAEIRALAQQDYDLTLQQVAMIVDAPPSQCHELALGIAAVAFGHAQMTTTRYSPVSTIEDAPRHAREAIALMIDGFRSRVQTDQPR